MVMDAIIRVIPSDPVMAHAAEVGVVFLWSRSSALTSPPTTQVQQMLNDLVDSEGSTSGDSSSSEEVFVVSLFVHDILVSQSCSGVVES